MYISANGRSRVENVITGQLKDNLRREYSGYTSLLKYWRDISAHGISSNISDNEAFTALALLLRFAQFGADN